MSRLRNRNRVLERHRVGWTTRSIVFYIRVYLVTPADRLGVLLFLAGWCDAAATTTARVVIG